MIVYLFFIIALSFDTFIAALSYETSRIKIPISSNIVISLVCSLVLSASLFLGNNLKYLVSETFLKWFSFIILFLLGLSKILNYQIKKIIKNKIINMSFKNLKLVIEVYSCYEKADLDKSKKLSVKEAIILALALSLDSLSAGLTFNTSYIYIIYLLTLSFFTNFIAILSTKIFKKININFENIAGMIFIIIAFTKL